MLLRLCQALVSPYVAADARRLIRCHGFNALFVVQAAVLKSEKAGGDAYWTRVLAEIERRVGYLPW